MLLDQLFEQPTPKELVIIRKDGEIKHDARPVKTLKEEPAKPLFPVSRRHQ